MAVLVPTHLAPLASEVLLCHQPPRPSFELKHLTDACRIPEQNLPTPSPPYTRPQSEQAACCVSLGASPCSSPTLQPSLVAPCTEAAWCQVSGKLRATAYRIWRGKGQFVAVSLVKYEKMDREKQPKDGRGGEAGHPALGFSPDSQGYLILLLIVQLLGIGIWLSDERVHQHQEGHVE